MRTFLLIVVMFNFTLNADEFLDHQMSRAEEFYYREEYNKAAALIDSLSNADHESQLLFYYGACCWSRAGDTEKALNYLDKTVEAGWLDREQFEQDEDLAVLKNEPGYDLIMAKLEENLKSIEAGLPDKHTFLEKLKLPDPSYDSDTSIEKAMLNRRSERKYLDQDLTLEQVSQILWAAYGITKPYPDGPEFLRGGLKTAPSAGALYPLEIYLVSRGVEDLKSGVYYYDPADHTLALLKEGDISSELAQAAWNQPWVKEAAFNIVYSAVFSRTTDSYGKRGRERYVCMDLGHSAQNIYLQCESMGLGTVAIGAFSDLELKRLVNMTRKEEPLYMMPIGKTGD